MKQLITLALIATSLTAAAQDTTKVKPKPQYQPDWNVKLQVPVSLTTGQIGNYFFVLQQGGPQKVAVSPQLSGQQITQYNTDYFAVTDSLTVATNRAIMAWDKAAQAKFTADTTKLYHPVGIKKGGR